MEGITLVGTQAELVTVEARFRSADQGRTEVLLSGLPDAVIRESRARLVCALEENGLRLGAGRLWLHLAPAGRRKTGEGLDLPMALGAAAACGHLEPRALRGALFLGEVGIDGALHAVPGGLAAAELGRRRGVRRLVAPPATAAEAACLPGTDARSARHLREVLAWASGTAEALEAARPAEEPEDDPREPRSLSLTAVRGQEAGKRALVAAAAGGHAVLFVGPPGTGKSLLARALPSLLPAPTLEERLDVTRVLSAAGRWPGGLARRRPFRAPHHTASYAGLVGGGNPPRPGEITLAHCGVLFLDELAEFRREVLEALRQPLESGSVLLSRAGSSVELPCRFHLVAAMNPCPCGYRGHARIPCRCSPAQVRSYRGRISGPLLDRVELRVELGPPPPSALVGGGADPGHAPAGPPAGAPAARVQRALATSRRRQGALPNARLDADALDALDPLRSPLRRLVENAALQRGLSARALVGLRRVARTLADLAGDGRIDERHFAEALSLRAPIEAP